MYTVAVIVCARGDNYPYNSANSDAAMHSARDSGRIRIRRDILAGNSELNCIIWSLGRHLCAIAMHASFIDKTHL